jgi:hypothetical protein
MNGYTKTCDQEVSAEECQPNIMSNPYLANNINLPAQPIVRGG